MGVWGVCAGCPHTSVHGCGWGRRHLADLSLGHCDGTTAGAPQCSRYGLLQVAQQLVALCRLLQVFPLLADALLQLLELLVGLPPPQVLQPLWGRARAGGRREIPSGQSRREALRVAGARCRPGIAVLARHGQGRLDGLGPRGVQGRPVVEVADLCARQSWGVRAVLVAVRLSVPGVPLVDQLTEGGVQGGLGRREGRSRHWLSATGLQLWRLEWWRGGLPATEPDYVGSGRGSRFTCNLPLIGSAFVTE